MRAFNTFPFDIFFEICTNLDLEDVVHLSSTCRDLRTLLINDAMAHRAVEMHHPFTEEARQARQGITTYKEAMCAIYERLHAFSTAKPFSARVVAQGNAFLYRQGVLCVQINNTVIVSNLRSGKSPVYIDLSRLSLMEHSFLGGDSYEMMYYSDDILAIHVRHGMFQDIFDNSVLFIRTSAEAENSRLITFAPLDFEPSKLFVRHTAQFFCLGTHTGNGRDGHRKWVIKSLRFDHHTSNDPVRVLLLEDFHGNDIGSTVAFEIHDGYFYAVSNQGTYEVEEVDWTSFYHCIRSPLGKSFEEAVQTNTRVYRRQHAEGAIHDSWTDLTLQHDERTNDLYIVESRREWVGASSQQARTFYAARINISNPASNEDSYHLGLLDNSVSSPRRLPDNDILTTVLGSSHNANYMPTPKQYSWTRHPEFPFTDCQSPTPRSFILARTKFRAYNFSSSTFMDLVEDGECCPHRHPASMPCLRLRIGSRRVAPAEHNSHYYEDGSPAAKFTITNDCKSSKRFHFEDDTRYRYMPVRMWPPPPTACPCSERLHNIMNPLSRPNTGMGLGQKTISAVCDERSIVYMVKPSPMYSYQSNSSDESDSTLGSIVLVDFGRSPAPESSEERSGILRWDRSQDQVRKCREGRC